MSVIETNSAVTGSLLRFALALVFVAGCRNSEPKESSSRQQPVEPHDTPALLPDAASISRTTSPGLAVSNLEAGIAELERRIAAGPDRAHLYPQLISLYLIRAHYLARLDDYQRAVELAAAHVRARPRSAQPYMLRARVNAALHRFAAALRDIDRAEQLGAHASETEAQRASIWLGLGRHQDALAVRRELARRHPGFHTLARLAAAHVERGDNKAAETAFGEALAAYRDVSPFDVAGLCFRWGHMYEEAGQLIRARHLYQIAHDRLPQYAEAAGHLAGVLARTGQIERAVSLLKTLVTSTDDPEYIGQLAELEKKRGHREVAAQLVLRATARFETLVHRHPEAFADHAARYFLTTGDNPVRAFELARRNLAVRQTALAYTLAIEAAMKADAAGDACSIAESAMTLPQLPRRLLFHAWRAFVGCGHSERADQLAKRLKIDHSKAP
ncbi:MAG: tetratricopeptide repeat protein [Proteobacteria bacterium]|nr:tetratricopeptide repeat protein [Pseudomonadota bacterium]